MNEKEITALHETIKTGVSISRDIALAILTAEADEIPQILSAANALRIRHFGNHIHLCSIVNAKSGGCEEDCAFCAQSSHHDCKADYFDLISAQDMKASYQQSSTLPIDHFGVVTSGEGLADEGVDIVSQAIHSGECKNIKWCASLGILEKEQLMKLKEKGLKRFHHNLETAESFFPKICTTHSYQERLDMVRLVKKSGLEICCGGIMGMGESLEQRIELAFTLQQEQVDSIPLNFHIPVAGTRLGDHKPMKPLTILKCIAMFRMVNPQAEIKVCAGRIHLGDLQSMIFYAGATGMMIGPLLTIAGRDIEDDLKMLRDLEVSF